MSQKINTAYKIKVDNISDNYLSECNIEDGSLVRTYTGLYMGHNGENVRVYPQSGESLGLGWLRVDDGEYTSSNKLALTDQVEVVLPNNASAIYHKNGDSFYNSTTKKLISNNENDVFVTTVVFKASASNANQTHLDLRLAGGGDISRVSMVNQFYKGNDVEQNFHQVMQYYTDSDFVSNGAQIKVQSDGGPANIWDIIFFIQKTQSYK